MKLYICLGICLSSKKKKFFFLLVAQLFPTLCDPMDYSTSGSSVYGIFQEGHWNSLPFLSPGNLPDPGIETGSPVLQADPLPTELPGKSLLSKTHVNCFMARDDTLCADTISKCMCWERSLVQLSQPWGLLFMISSLLSSVHFSHSVVSDSLWPHELQHARPPCLSQTPGVHANSHPSSQWCHPAISSSVVIFSCPQSLPASASFPMSQLC